MNDYLEQPFEYLRRKADGEKFKQEDVNNWYKARAFVLDLLKTFAFKPKANAHLHVVVVGDDSLMLSVARQVALTAHFVNYDEQNEDEKKRNRTVISIVSQDPNIESKIRQEEYLCNLPKHCKCTFFDEAPKNKDSYIDVELRVIKDWTGSMEEYKRIETENHTEHRFVVTRTQVGSFCVSKNDIDVFYIDTRKAQYADRMYNLGNEIKNIPYEDIHSAKRYEMALNVFQQIKMEEKIGKIVDKNEWERKENQTKVLMGLSNVFCADCFLIRYYSIKPCWENGEKTERQAWEEHYDVVSKSEHARWVVEKLILGYHPMSLKERLADESNAFCKEKRDQYRKSLKNNWESPTHIDLCSFANLRRVDPDNMKYDSFLTLGIPDILKKVGEIPKKG